MGEEPPALLSQISSVGTMNSGIAKSSSTYLLPEIRTPSFCLSLCSPPFPCTHQAHRVGGFAMPLQCAGFCLGVWIVEIIAPC